MLYYNFLISFHSVTNTDRVLRRSNRHNKRCLRNKTSRQYVRTLCIRVSLGSERFLRRWPNERIRKCSFSVAWHASSVRACHLSLHVPFARAIYPAAPYPRGEQSTTIRLLFTTRTIHAGFRPSRLSLVPPLPRRGNLACPRFLSSRTIPITKVPLPIRVRLLIAVAIVANVARSDTRFVLVIVTATMVPSSWWKNRGSLLHNSLRFKVVPYFFLFSDRVFFQPT